MHAAARVAEGELALEASVNIGPGPLSYDRAILVTLSTCAPMYAPAVLRWPLLVPLFIAASACASPKRRQASSGAPPFRADNAELPGPAPRGRTPEQAATLNSSCEGCHVEIAREWRQSLHARAHTDAAYQRALSIEPLAFCQGCHAPEADPNRPVPASVGTIGVACVTCHVVNGTILASNQRDRPKASTSKASLAPHPVLRDGRLDATNACVGCHEFEFPDRSARARPELMQSTISEHARSLEPGTPCADCHMPRADKGEASYRSHSFSGGRDATFVRSAVQVTARRTSEVSIRISITPRRLGHAFPTGDLFRRLEVSAEAIGSEWQVVAQSQRYLARHWERQKGPFGVVVRRAVSDDRPLASPVDIDLKLGATAARLPILWRVAYQRVEHPRSERESDSAIEGEIEIASGTLENDR